MKESDLDRIQNEAETARDEIQTYREWLKREIDGLAETTIDKLQAKHTECSDAINEEISQLKTAIAQNEEKKKKLDDAKDDTEAFLLLKQVQQGKCNDKTLIRDMKESPDRTTTFMKDMAIEDFIIYQTSLGEVIGNYVFVNIEIFIYSSQAFGLGQQFQSHPFHFRNIFFTFSQMLMKYLYSIHTLVVSLCHLLFGIIYKVIL